MANNVTPTPLVSIRNVSKTFGAFVALNEVNIDIEPGEVFALLGPSGCGKSTLLRIIAGFETPTTGDISIDSKDMTDTAPNRRPVNMVFQSYAVFPHMSVAKNVAYGLKAEGRPASEIKQRVNTALAQVHLSEFKDRMPHQLSGGQRQRVALARALVKKPRVLLLDEPLSALDAKLRDAMRLELVKLQKSVGVTFIIVTHDQSEALAMADRIAVLKDGLIRQIASPQELYERPADEFVADFVGKINLFRPTHAAVENNRIKVTDNTLGRLDFALSRLSTSPPIATGDNTTPDIVLGIRPENVTVTLEPTGSDRLSGTLGDIAYQGRHSALEILLADGHTVSAEVDQSHALQLSQAQSGSTVYCQWPDQHMLVLRAG